MILGRLWWNNTKFLHNNQEKYIDINEEKKLSEIDSERTD